MNARCLILVLAAVAPVGAMAESPKPTATLMINCTYAHWPTQDQVTRNLRIPVVTVGEAEPKPQGLAYASAAEAKEAARHLQQFIRRQGRHECELGASHVQVDFRPQGRRMAVAVVGGISP